MEPVKWRKSWQTPKKNCRLSFVLFCGPALRYWPSARIHFPSCESPQIQMDRTNPGFVKGKTAWHSPGNKWQLSCHTSCQARLPKMTSQTQPWWKGKSIMHGHAMMMDGMPVPFTQDAVGSKSKPGQSHPVSSQYLRTLRNYMELLRINQVTPFLRK